MAIIKSEFHIKTKSHNEQEWGKACNINFIINWISDQNNTKDRCNMEIKIEINDT